MDSETGKVNEYMLLHNIADARMMFRIRTNMLELKANMKNRYGDKEGSLECEACKTGMLESTLHVLECLGYNELRVGLDLSKLKDMVSYYREVMEARFLQD